MRSAVKDFCGQIGEGTGMTDKQIFEECGAETDEENGIVFAEFGL